MNAYWAEHGQFLASAASESGYQSAWADAIGDAKRAAEIAQADVAAAVARWRQRGKISSSTINHYLGFLQRVWRRVPLYQGFRVQPIEWKLLKLDEPEPPDRSRTEAEIRAYLDALPARSIPITLWSLFTGLRRSALLRLTRPDLDFERGIIHATSKGRAGGKPTPVAMSQPILAVMTMYPVPAVGRVFAVTKQQLRDDREKARAAVGMTDFRFHDLRHTFAQALEDAGYGDAITAALHHSSPALRSRYSRARLRRTEAAIDATFATRNRHHA